MNQNTRLLATCLLAVSILSVRAESPPAQYSALWSEGGENWTPRSRLPDFSFAGYQRGERPLPALPPGVSVKDFGATGDGETDDTAAFLTVRLPLVVRGELQNVTDGELVSGPVLTRAVCVPFIAPMICNLRMNGLIAVGLLVLLGAGCATKEPALPPLRAAVLADSPAQVAAALPGEWTIDVAASAEVLARTQFQPREVTLVRREGMAPTTKETTTVTERFDPKAYREARRYWADLLSKPDMQWRLRFNADGTGDHMAIVQTGSAPQATPFKWRLDGWRLSVDYATGAKFSSFTVEAPSAVELNYPMQPLGDHLVLRRAQK